MTHRVLYLLRHADAEPTPPQGYRDEDRPLSARGVAQAQNVGGHLREQLPPVQLALCSDAVRTQETLAQLGLDVPVQIDDELYRAGGATIRDTFVGIADDVACVLVVGHAPGIPAAVHLLTDRSQSDAVALERVDTVYLTATLSRLEFDGDWVDLADGREEFAALVDAFRG